MHPSPLDAQLLRQSSLRYSVRGNRKKNGSKRFLATDGAPMHTDNMRMFSSVFIGAPSVANSFSLY
jgi:hypothetical protein